MKIKVTQNEKGTPKQTKNGDWPENENWAKTRSEETKIADDDWPGWGVLRKTQATEGAQIEEQQGPDKERERRSFGSRQSPFAGCLNAQRNSRETVSGEYLETSLAVRRGMSWIKSFVRALTKVEREGEPKARCQ
jgi:hypothetical protein